MSQDRNFSAQQRCSICYQKERRCACRFIKKKIHSPIEIIILQDAQEVDHALNTCALILAAITNSRRVLSTQAEAFSIQPANAIVLFPKEGAYPLPRMHPDPSTSTAYPDSLREAQTLIVLDATWNRIAFLYRTFPWLHQLPHVALEGALEGRYILRKASQSFQLSTLEATAYAITSLHQNAEMLSLLEPLEALMEEQIIAMGPETFRKNYQHRASYEQYAHKLFPKS